MGVEAFVGYHGNGKTYSALAMHVMPALERGSSVVSNAIIRGYVRSPEWCASEPGTPMPPILHFETWDELIEVIERMIAESCRATLLIDEAGKFLSNRFWQKLDERMLIVLQERRKIGRGLDFVFTAPAFSKVDPMLRDVTQLVHTCRRFGGSEYSHDGGKPPKAFVVTSYRGEEYEKAKKSRVDRRIVPFSKTLADCYTTGVVTMGKPNERKHASQPDMRDAPAVPPAIVPVMPVAPPSSGRRAKRKA